MTRSSSREACLAALLMAGMLASPVLAGRQLPEVSADTIWIGTVQQGDLTTEVRGPGVIERVGQALGARVRIAAVQARDVEIGQTATVDTRSEVLEGHVVDIADRVQQGTRVIHIEISSEIPSELRADTSVDARVQTGRLEDVLYTERPAFARSDGTVEIFRLTDDGELAERVEVTWGTSSVDRIVVARGLQAGDRIILSDMSRYDGVDRVRIVQ